MLPYEGATFEGDASTFLVAGMGILSSYNIEFRGTKAV